MTTLVVVPTIGQMGPPLPEILLRVGEVQWLGSVAQALLRTLSGSVGRGSTRMLRDARGQV